MLYNAYYNSVDDMLAMRKVLSDVILYSEASIPAKEVQTLGRLRQHYQGGANLSQVVPKKIDREPEQHESLELPTSANEMG